MAPFWLVDSLGWPAVLVVNPDVRIVTSRRVAVSRYKPVSLRNNFSSRWERLARLQRAGSPQSDPRGGIIPTFRPAEAVPIEIAEDKGFKIATLADIRLPPSCTDPPSAQIALREIREIAPVLIDALKTLNDP